MAREDTQDLVEKTKIESAIYRLKDKGSDINPYTVAEEAGLDRAAVSHDKDAMELIIKARGGDITFEPPNTEVLRRCNELDATILEMENENNLLAIKVSELEDKLLQPGAAGAPDDSINEQVKALLSSESDVQLQQMERELEQAYSQVVQLQEDSKDLGHSVKGLEKVNEALNARLRELEDENKALKESSSGDDSGGKDDGSSYSGTDPDELVSANREMKRRIKDQAEANRKQLRRIKDLENASAETTRTIEALEQQRAELQQEAESLGAQLSNTWNVAYQKGSADSDEKAKKSISEAQAKMQAALQSLQQVQAKSEAQFQSEVQSVRAEAQARAAEVEMLQSEVTDLRQALSQAQMDLAASIAAQQQAQVAYTEQFAPPQVAVEDEQNMTGPLVAYGSPQYQSMGASADQPRTHTYEPTADMQIPVAVNETVAAPEVETPVAIAEMPQAVDQQLHNQFQEDQELQQQLLEQQNQVQMQEQQMQSQLQEQSVTPFPDQTIPPNSANAQEASSFGNRLYDPVVADGGEQILNFARTGPYVGSQANPLENLSWRDLETVYSMGVLSIKDFARNIPDPYKKPDEGDVTIPPTPPAEPVAQNYQQPAYDPPPIYDEQEPLYEQPPFYGELYEKPPSHYVDEPLYQPDYQDAGAYQETPPTPSADPYSNYARPDNGGYGNQEYTGQDFDNQNVPAGVIGSESLTSTSESAVIDPQAFVDDGVLDLDQLDIFEDLEELEDLSKIEIMADDPLVGQLLDESDKPEEEVSPEDLNALVVSKIQQTKDMNEQAAAARALAAAGGNGEETAKRMHKFVGTKATQQIDAAVPPPATNPVSAANFVRAKPVPPEIKKHLGILGLPLDGLTKEVVMKEWKRQASENHPDKGGDRDVAAAINVAKEELLKYLEKNEPKLGKKFGKKPTQPD